MLTLAATVPLRVTRTNICASDTAAYLREITWNRRRGDAPRFENVRNRYCNREDRPSGLAATRGGPAIEKSIVLQLTRSATAFLNANQPRGREKKESRTCSMQNRDCKSD